MSALVVSAVAAVAVAAAVDALRSPDEGERARGASPALQETERLAFEKRGSQPPMAVERKLLAALGAAGVLIYSDANDGCRLKALRLPDLLPSSPPKARSCTFEASSDGRRSLGTAVWRPGNRLAAACRHGATDVFTHALQPLYRLAGCTPAWRGDGALTVVRKGSVVAYELPCPKSPRRCDRELLRPVDLARALPFVRAATVQNKVFERAEVHDLTWVGPARAALLLTLHWSYGGSRGARDRSTVLAVFDERRPVMVTELWEPYRRLRASPRGHYLAVVDAEGEAIRVLRVSGEEVALPQLAGARAAAFSPDERLLAVVTRASVFVTALVDGERRITPGTAARTVRLPIAARDVTWTVGP